MALSPMMEHYLSMKEKYKDCVLFFRLGDFYEMFFDDGQIGLRAILPSAKNLSLKSPRR